MTKHNPAPDPTHRPPKPPACGVEGAPASVLNIPKWVYLLPLMELFSCKTLEELQQKIDREIAQMKSLNLNRKPPGPRTATEASIVGDSDA